MPKAEKIPVTFRGLIQRINRKLAERGEMLKKTRGTAARSEVGDYFVVDVNRNILMVTHVNPESLGRKLEVLQPWESVR